MKSVQGQQLMPGEIIIADDGSDVRTKTVIDVYKDKLPVPVKHVWQEDKGFRLAIIRNKAIAVAEGDYIIQVDGDMILHPLFIKDHAGFAKKKSFVRASRIYLNATLSEEMLSNKCVNVNVFHKGVSNTISGLRMPLLWPFFENTYKNKGDERFEIHGCNMAFWKEDAVLVNGYNELFYGWGPEDKEFITRLLNTGVRKRFLKLGGVAYHIFHKENLKNRLEFNEGLLKQAIKQKKTYCSSGLNQYIK